LLPWSPKADEDDLRLTDFSELLGKEVIVTEKLDGENTTLYREGLHARSLMSGAHPSRTWVGGLHGRIGALLPERWRVCGENMFAKHSLTYDDLASYYYVFSVWNEHDHCLNWDETKEWAALLELPTPPELYRGVFDEDRIRDLKVDTQRQEGFVLRSVEGFPFDAFARRVCKWVRPAHVQTSKHWMFETLVPNRLAQNPSRARRGPMP
jgi:hypothetical protein